MLIDVGFSLSLILADTQFLTIIYSLSQGGDAAAALSDTACYTVHCVPKKHRSKFFHSVISRKILYVHTQRFPPYLQYVVTLPCEIRKPEKVTKFSR